MIQPKKNSRRKRAKRLFFSVAIVVGVIVFFNSRPTQEEKVQLKLKNDLDHRTQLSEALAESMRHEVYPATTSMNWDGYPMNMTVHYTFDADLQAQAEKILKQYKPDYGSIVMMDAMSGKILAIANFQKDATDHPNLALRSTYPAASVFKIVTATAAIDKVGVRPMDTIRYNGGNYTLYRKNVLSDKINKWTRSISLKEAFARSINTAFGRLSLEKLSPELINDYAKRFMFNQKIPSDLPVDMGVAFVPQEKGFELTEVASGYNKMNRMSPVQGVMIAASVINEGRMVVPYIVDNLRDPNGQVVYQAEIVDSGPIMTSSSADKVRELMEQTIISGTSRKTFRDLVKNRQFRDVEMGGKTGHYTGDNPKGKVDWFIGYASDDVRKIAVAALTVNKVKWTVKSSYLGRTMIRKYFEPVIKEKVASTGR
jgi:peptidoglycan glycosyltransferase